MTRELHHSVGLLNSVEAYEVLNRACAEVGIAPSLIERLIRVEQDYSGMLRRRGLFDEIERLLDVTDETDR